MKYKTTLTYELSTQITTAIEYLFSSGSESIDTVSNMCAIAALAEVVIVLRKKQIEYKREYKITFTAVQALALCYFYQQVEGLRYSIHFTNRLLQIHNEVLQQCTL